MKGDIYDELAARWPSPIVARKEVGRFSGGVLNPRSMANFDSLREHTGKIQIGPRQVAYDVEKLVLWMRNRSTKKTMR